MIKIFVIAAAAVMGLGAFFLTKKADGPLEQAAEKIIEIELGAPSGSIDLSPEKNRDKIDLSPEKNRDKIDLSSEKNQDKED